MSQSIKSSKIKKSSKDREKRKSLVGSYENCNNNANEKPSSSTESASKKYAGLSIDNIRAAAEQITFPELLSKELCEVLAEDLNYKLRYIIHQASNRAIISNRTAINSEDIEETFADLSIDKVYGSISDPVWIPFGDQNYFYLDDPKVNVIEETEKELAFSQPTDPIIVKTWLPGSDEPSAPLKNYFRTICEAAINNDIDMRKIALQNVSSNPNIGPIIDWFYKFGYMLLSKDITYDSLTLYALDLIETLEMSPLGNTTVSENQLRLLVRLILQRLLKSVTNTEVLKPMCWVLAILCRRYPLREFVITKLIQKLPELSMEFSLPLIVIVNALGIDAIMTIFVNNIELFLSTIVDNWQLYGYTIMETYHILYKNGIQEMSLYNKFPDLREFTVVPCRPVQLRIPEEKNQMDFINMKIQLLKTRRKMESHYMKTFVPYESVFEVPNYRSRMKKKLENHYKTNYHMGWKRQSHFVVGKTSVLLPVLKTKPRCLPKCSDHSLLSYNL